MSNQFANTDLDLDLPLPSFGNLSASHVATDDFDYSSLLSTAGLDMPNFDTQKSTASGSDSHEQWLKDSTLDISQLNLPVKLSRSTTQGVTGMSRTDSHTSQGAEAAADSTVKACPAWVERHTSFKSRSTPATILQRCSAALLQQHADFVTNAKKHKIKGVAYVNGSIVHFVCRVYNNTLQQDHLSVPAHQAHHGSATPEYIVEFQKRSGCAMAFNSLYRDIIAQITDIYHSNIDGDQSLPPLTSLSRTISQAEDSDVDSAPASPKPDARPDNVGKPRRARAYTEQFGLATGVAKLSMLPPPATSTAAMKMALTPEDEQEQQKDTDAIVAGAGEAVKDQQDHHDHDHHDHEHHDHESDYDENVQSGADQPRKRASVAEAGLAPTEGSQNLCVKNLGDHTLCSLLSMALSDDGCSAREAISALAGLPSNVIVKAIGANKCTGECSNLSMHGLVNALCRALEGGDSQLTRSAAVLLANLSEEPSFAEHLLEKDEIVTPNSTSGGGEKDHANLINQVFTLLNFPTCFSAKCKEARGDCGFTNRFPALILRDIKRQVAKALANITLVQPKQMLQLILAARQTSKIDYKDVLERYKVSPCADPRLQSYVEVAIERIGAMTDTAVSYVSEKLSPAKHMPHDEEPEAMDTETVTPVEAQAVKQ